MILLARRRGGAFLKKLKKRDLEGEIIFKSSATDCLKGKFKIHPLNPCSDKFLFFQD